MGNDLAAGKRKLMKTEPARVPESLTNCAVVRPEGYAAKRLPQADILPRSGVLLDKGTCATVQRARDPRLYHPGRVQCQICTTKLQ
jgi:hypothetical protein